MADIGFPEDLLASDLLLVEPADVLALLPMRDLDGHKRSSGVVAIVAGSRDMPGAASLVASGAGALGAGLIRLASVPSALGPASGGHPEATLLRLPETEAGALAAGAWEVVAGELARAHALAIGPGLTAGDETAAEVRRAVLESPVPVVADADALNAFAGRAADLAAREGGRWSSRPRGRVRPPVRRLARGPARGPGGAPAQGRGDDRMQRCC